MGGCAASDSLVVFEAVKITPRRRPALKTGLSLMPKLGILAAGRASGEMADTPDLGFDESK